MAPPIIVLTGPTAAGKTDIAVRLAQALGTAEIISADSRQIYRGMDLGTAKPTPAQQVIPHHLIDILRPSEAYSAGDFAVAARAAIAAIAARGGISIVVGGSGLYVQALLDGLIPVPPTGRGAARAAAQELAAADVESLLARLAHVDPLAARRIGRQDVRRLTRAVEMAELGVGSTGRWCRDAGMPADVAVYCCLTRERSRLYERIDRRAAAMLAGGLLDEAAALRAAGYPASAPGLQTLGYPEALACLRGELDRTELLVRLQRGTRHYAKRQFTWFARDRRLRWLDVDSCGTEGCVQRLLAQYRRRTAADICCTATPVDTAVPRG